MERGGGCTVLSRRRGSGGPVFLKIVVGLSVLAAVRLQELGPHRQTESSKTNPTVKWKDLKPASATVHVSTSADLPTFLGTEAQHFRAFGTFGALGSPMGAQSQVSISLFVRRRL